MTVNVALRCWQRTPWGKASKAQWRYALRNALAMCLALWIAFALALDQPFWAMTSAAVVSFPTIGGVISKSIGRIIGSLLGASASLLIAGHSLSDPWLFVWLISIWIALCTYVSNQYQNNVSYAFALAGYTTAIIAFSVVDVTDAQDIFALAQARVSEVIIGILCGGAMMMILPSTSDSEALLNALKRIQQQLPEHAEQLWQPIAASQVRTLHEGVIAQILTLNLLRIQAFWSHHQLRRQNSRMNLMIHQQLYMTSMISSLRRMLLNWHNPPDNLSVVLKPLLAQLRDSQTDKYQLAKTLQLIRPLDTADYRHRAFWVRLRHFCWLYLDCNHQLQRLEQGGEVQNNTATRVSAPMIHTDNYEAAYSTLRSFLCIVVGCSFWLNTHWDSGNAALTLTAISCVLYASTPSPISSITTLLKSVSLLSISSFLVMFGLMVQIEQLGMFMAFLFPVLVTMQMFKLQHPAYASLWTQLIVYMGSFLSISTPPSYDYQSVINENLAKISGVLLAAMAFQLLRPSSDKRKSKRLIRALHHDFVDQLGQKPRHTERQFESLIYHRISQLSQSKDQDARAWLLRWGVVLLNCSHVVWQLREWQTRSDPLSVVRDSALRCLHGIITPTGVQLDLLQAALPELQRISDALGRHPNPASQELAGLVWRLSCSLPPLLEQNFSSRSIAETS